MAAWFANPAWLLIIGGLILPLFGYRLRCALLLIVPVIAAVWLLQMPRPLTVETELLGYALMPVRLDGLSFVFALIFLIAAFLTGLFMLSNRSRLEPAAMLVYAGAAVAAALAGDLLTLFLYWEATALASVLIILANGPQTFRVSMRYLVMQVASGLLLLTGALIYFRSTGSFEFGHLGLDAPGGWLIFFAFGIKAAFPFLHNWLQDAYPAASPTGTVALSAFTTKLAIYALARGYAGTEILIPIGALMTAFPIFYAVIENDLRRVLAYSLNNQLGFMVVGIGIGTELALNGTAAHAFTHILYKALLFMSMGAVLYRAGTVKGSELGGLYKSMPWTMVFCVVGAASISAFPLFSGFISKSLILSSAGYQGLWFVWLVLVFASAGVFHHSGIKIPFFAFFAHDSGIRCKEAPWNMLLAMGITAALCIGIGVFPGPLYDILPYAVDYEPYTASHVLTQMQLLLFSALAFTVLMRTGIYPPELRSTNLDSDWLYRRLLPAGIDRIALAMEFLFEQFARAGRRVGTTLTREGYDGMPGRTWPVGAMALWVAALLAVLLIFGILETVV
ncbi:Na(+)/H(+) antiporter subunit D [Wenzhouxiangella sp. EGI_FJ10305]|uniref:Na(+)/H(+) antiporter subunit D n=1 Tax=Wenzhouxiangella sp. EGI_FJ10305 TaxID=3243768 RepID=UPI0035E13358